MLCFNHRRCLIDFNLCRSPSRSNRKLRGIPHGIYMFVRKQIFVCTTNLFFQGDHEWFISNHRSWPISLSLETIMPDDWNSWLSQEKFRAKRNSRWDLWLFQGWIHVAKLSRFPSLFSMLIFGSPRKFHLVENQICLNERIADLSNVIFLDLTRIITFA